MHIHLEDLYWWEIFSENFQKFSGNSGKIGINFRKFSGLTTLEGFGVGGSRHLGIGGGLCSESKGGIDAPDTRRTFVWRNCDRASLLVGWFVRLFVTLDRFGFSQSNSPIFVKFVPNVTINFRRQGLSSGQNRRTEICARGSRCLRQIWQCDISNFGMKYNFKFKMAARGRFALSERFLVLTEITHTPVEGKLDREKWTLHGAKLVSVKPVIYYSEKPEAMMDKLGDVL